MTALKVEWNMKQNIYDKNNEFYGWSIKYLLTSSEYAC